MSELIAGGRAIDWILGLVALEAVLPALPASSAQEQFENHAL